MIVRHFLIRGRVQGVGFRYALQTQARRLKLHGWVRNRSDGQVEAVAGGAATALDALERWTHRGPPNARVDGVEIRVASADESADLDPRFNQRPTL